MIAIHKKLTLYKKHKALFLLFIPGLAYYLLFKYAPLYGIQIAFKEYIFRRGIVGSPWVGLENFRMMFSLKSFWQVLRNTLVISSYKFLWGFPAPILLAVLLNEVRHMKFKKAVQTISYLPHFLSWVVLGSLFTQFLSPSIGPINIFMKSVGMPPIFFLADAGWFRSVLVTTSIWKGIGWGSIIYLAAITGIDPGMYEAAQIDGAGRIQRIWHITIPSLMPVITVMFLLNLRTIVQDDFDQIFNLYNPAVYTVGDVLSTYTYRMGLVDMRYSFSTAVGLFQNIIAFIFVVGANAVTKRVNEYGLW